MYHLETILAQIGNRSCEQTGAISTPLYFSTAYRHHEIGISTGYDYSRTGNPTRSVLEKAAAHLEKGDQAFACSSGMSAIQLILSLFQTGDHLILTRDLYGGTYRLFDMFSQKYGLSVTYWSGREESLEQLIQPNTKAIFIETPTNPLMNEVDLSKIATLTTKHKLLFIVDNTFYTPIIQKPLEYGADIVIHSATKYLAGHNDVLAGLVISKGEKLTEQLALLHNACGPVLSPFDCWLVIRGLKTLALRIKQHEKKAQAITQFLQAHPFVTDVLYPGRGGMVCFRIIKEDYISPFLKALRLFTFAESLGGVESLITYPATQTHAEIPEDIRSQYGLCNRLLRISAGIEHEEDLINDLKQAFAFIERGCK
ncbi:methionine biosynthesis PLP-dependent protein [Bacillus aquiflavi]|uniref:methionine biosynthesis PLP-dependent protein n=1 Tax=Bacillus aquiflavi TaxID=2672567 RepID=UPI001CAA01B1|nr:methionine biosynthesis PLP-dependent protein [Bacillus aquiflavi]UAC50158.1 methionine biosynthesis PLP-dependent protein [Bacillus aquiflavi]